MVITFSELSFEDLSSGSPLRPFLGFSQTATNCVLRIFDFSPFAEAHAGGDI